MRHGVISEESSWYTTVLVSTLSDGRTEQSRHTQSRTTRLILDLNEAW